MLNRLHFVVGHDRVSTFDAHSVSSMVRNGSAWNQRLAREQEKREPLKTGLKNRWLRTSKEFFASGCEVQLVCEFRTLLKQTFHLQEPMKASEPVGRLPVNSCWTLERSRGEKGEGLGGSGGMRHSSEHLDR